jgi:hypothetical protein
MVPLPNRNNVEILTLAKKPAGQSLIEVTVGIVVLIPAILVLLDLAMILYGVQLNESTCRNAVRAAASGDPEESKYRAQAVIDRVNERTYGHLVSEYKLVMPVETKIVNQPAMEKDPDSGRPVCTGGPITGFIGITTEVEIKPFIVHLVYGGQSPLKFRARQTFPISYIVPSLSTQQ